MDNYRGQCEYNDSHQLNVLKQYLTEKLSLQEAIKAIIEKVTRNGLTCTKTWRT